MSNMPGRLFSSGTEVSSHTTVAGSGTVGLGGGSKRIATTVTSVTKDASVYSVVLGQA